MYANLALGIICLLLVLFIKDKKTGLEWAFFIGTIFLAIRYGWGNDYMNYLNEYIISKNYVFDLFDIEAAKNVQRHSEWLWLLLNRFFAITRLGFFGLVIVLTVFESWTLYRMVKKYVDPIYYWVAILFWIFSKSFCINASMMRQFLCICIYLNVVDLMIENNSIKHLLWSIVIIWLGSFIHRSFFATIISLPLFYIHFNNKRTATVLSIIVGVAFVLWTLFGRSIIEPLMLNFIEDSEEFSGYMSYIEREKSRGIESGFGVLFSYVTLAAWLLILPKIDKKRQPLVSILVFSFFFNVVTEIVSLAGRLSLYFSVVSMLCWTYLFEYGKKWKVLYAIFAGELIILARDFIHLYSDPLWHEYFYNYHTIFEAGMWM